MDPLKQAKPKDAPPLDDVDQINKCFLEADRLYAAAFEELSTVPHDPETIRRFSSMKQIADAKFAEARARWQYFRNYSLRK